MLTLAHGIVGRADLPIPATLFGVAAAVVLVLSFLALAAGWTRPKLETPRERPLFGVPLAIDVLLGAVGVAVFVLSVHAGLTGTSDPLDNLASVTIAVTFWVGVPVVSLFVGDVWRLVSPWRAVGRLVGWALARAGGGETEALPYPPRLGRWPAVVVVFGFALVELCWGKGSEPSALAVLALLVFVVNLAGQGLYGVEAWSRNGDGFGVYFGLFAALSPWRRDADRRLVLRPPLSGAPGIARPAGTVALLCVAIGSTTFDGAKEGPLFGSVAPRLQDGFEALGLSIGAALEWAFVVGLLVCVLLVAALYRIGVAGIGAAGGTLRERSRDYVHTLIPIAVAYVVAHYFSYLVYNVQLMWPLLSQPSGGANGTIDYSVVSATAIWYVQVVSLVLGHVAAIVLAHDRALARAAAARDAARSQLVMLVVMVAFTSLGLWLLSVSNA